MHTTSLLKLLKKHNYTRYAFIREMGYNGITHFSYWNVRLSGRRKMNKEEFEKMRAAAKRLFGEEVNNIQFDSTNFILL